MADMKAYRVLRDLDGDRFYRAGETREMLPADAIHLLRLGVLSEIADEDDGGEPTQEPPANKAEGATRKTKG